MSPEPSIFSSTIRRSSAPVIWIYLQYIFPPLGSALCAIHDRLVPFILLFVVNYWITLFREIRIPSRRVVWTQNLCRLPFVPQIELPLETTLNFNLISGEYCALPRETKKPFPVDEITGKDHQAKFRWKVMEDWRIPGRNRRKLAPKRDSPSRATGWPTWMNLFRTQIICFGSLTS